MGLHIASKSGRRRHCFLVWNFVCLFCQPACSRSNFDAGYLQWSLSMVDCDNDKTPNWIGSILFDHISLVCYRVSVWFPPVIVGTSPWYLWWRRYDNRWVTVPCICPLISMHSIRAMRQPQVRHIPSSQTLAVGMSPCSPFQYGDV